MYAGTKHRFPFTLIFASFFLPLLLLTLISWYDFVWIVYSRAIVTAAEQEQIKQTYSVLCQRSGTNKINQPTFVQYWTDYVDPIIADRLWLIFDTKFDSFLDFEEWATGLSNTLRGNKDDRVKCTSWL